MYITNRSVATTIILSIVTCGIYYYVWMYQTSQDVNNTIGDTSENAGLEILFTIITCGIYGYYWLWKYNKKLFDLSLKMGKNTSDNSVVCLVLAIFGFSIVSQGIMQSQINFLAQPQA